MKITLSELKQIIRNEVKRERVINEISRIDGSGATNDVGITKFLSKIKTMIKGRIRTGVHPDTEPPTVVLYTLPTVKQKEMLEKILDKNFLDQYKIQKDTVLFKIFISDDNKINNQISHLIQTADENNIEIYKIPKEERHYSVGLYDRNRWDGSGEMPGSSGESGPKHAEWKKEKLTIRQYSNK